MGALRGCSCLNCTNLFECTCRSVGAVETTAPPESAPASVPLRGKIQKTKPLV